MAIRWCLDCERIEAQDGGELCYRCIRRQAVGQPRMVEVELAAEVKARNRYVLLPGFYDKEL